MRSRFPIPVALLLLIVTGAGPRAQETPRERLEEAVRRNRLLEMEYALIKEPKLYLVFKLSERAIEFRLRGMLLQSIPVEETLVLGNLPHYRTVLNLRIKETTRPPQRMKVNPQEAAEEVAKAEAEKQSGPPDSPTTTVPSITSPLYNDPTMLELKDMPTRYNLVFDEGLNIMIRPKEVPIEEKGFAGWLQRWGVRWSDALAAVRRRLGKPQVPQLRLTLSEDHCRWIFWSVSENTKMLVVP